MNVGDVYQVEFPPRGGHEQAGSRPAIIVQAKSASAQLPTVLCVPFTSQLDALRFPGTVLVEAHTENGLRRASVALLFQLTAIDQRRLKGRIGCLSAERLAAIWQAFDALTDRVVQSEGPSPSS